MTNMTVKTVTFYTFDPYKNKYWRVAVIQSEGVANLLLPTLKELYPDNLYWIYGEGKKFISPDPTLVLNRIK